MKSSLSNRSGEVSIICLCLLACVPIFSAGSCVAALVPDTILPSINGNLESIVLKPIVPDTSPPRNHPSPPAGDLKLKQTPSFL
jgi:hypothetical protein